MLKLIQTSFVLAAFVVFSQSSKAQPPVVDSVSGVLSANGAANSGKIKLDAAGTTLAASIVNGVWEKWNGKLWVATNITCFQNVNGALAFTLIDQRTLVTGASYRVYLTVERGNQVIVSSYTNAFVAP